MQLLRISFGHGVRVGSSTYTHLDLEKPEFKSWTVKLDREIQSLLITDSKQKTILVPLGNVAYFEVRTDETRPEANTTPGRSREKTEGKARAS